MGSCTSKSSSEEDLTDFNPNPIPYRPAYSSSSSISPLTKASRASPGITTNSKPAGVPLSVSAVKAAKPQAPTYSLLPKSLSSSFNLPSGGAEVNTNVPQSTSAMNLERRPQAAFDYSLFPKPPSSSPAFASGSKKTTTAVPHPTSAVKLEKRNAPNYSRPFKPPSSSNTFPSTKESTRATTTLSYDQQRFRPKKMPFSPECVGSVNEESSQQKRNERPRVMMPWAQSKGGIGPGRVSRFTEEGLSKKPEKRVCQHCEAALELSSRPRNPMFPMECPKGCEYSESIPKRKGDREVIY